MFHFNSVSVSCFTASVSVILYLLSMFIIFVCILIKIKNALNKNSYGFVYSISVIPNKQLPAVRVGAIDFTVEKSVEKKTKHKPPRFAGHGGSVDLFCPFYCELVISAHL